MHGIHREDLNLGSEQLKSLANFQICLSLVQDVENFRGIELWRLDVKKDRLIPFRTT